MRGDAFVHPQPRTGSRPPASGVRGLELLHAASEAVAQGEPRSAGTSPESSVHGASKVKKKRGRKPTPGLTEEDRRQARLLKNRRTAEMSRRRKMQYVHDLKAECESFKGLCAKLQRENDALRAQLAKCVVNGFDIGNGAERRFCEARTRRDDGEVRVQGGILEVSSPVSVSNSSLVNGSTLRHSGASS